MTGPQDTFDSGCSKLMKSLNDENANEVPEIIFDLHCWRGALDKVKGNFDNICVLQGNFYMRRLILIQKRLLFFNYILLT